MRAIDEKLDEAFSKYTRLVFADYRGYVHCYTCAWVGLWTECDCGHFIRRQHHAVRWDKRNGRPQCRRCNRELDGVEPIFEEELRDELGDKEVDALISISKNVKYLSEQEKITLLSQMNIHIKALEKGEKVL
jgi:hypothetical protein